MYPKVSITERIGAEAAGGRGKLSSASILEAAVGLWFWGSGSRDIGG